MNEFKIGDKIEINPSSEYAARVTIRNPMGVRGTVSDIDEASTHSIRVYWDTGEFNVYRPTDLLLWKRESALATEVEITPTLKMKYIATKGADCPICESSNLSHGMLEQDTHEAETVLENVTCEVCHATWVNKYALTTLAYLKRHESPMEKLLRLTQNLPTKMENCWLLSNQAEWEKLVKVGKEIRYLAKQIVEQNKR